MLSSTPIYTPAYTLIDGHSRGEEDSVSAQFDLADPRREMIFNVSGLTRGCLAVQSG